MLKSRAQTWVCAMRFSSNTSRTLSLTCLLSKMTNCFNKTIPLTKGSVCGDTSLWADLIWEIHRPKLDSFTDADLSQHFNESTRKELKKETKTRNRTAAIEGARAKQGVRWEDKWKLCCSESAVKMVLLTVWSVTLCCNFSQKHTYFPDSHWNGSQGSRLESKWKSGLAGPCWSAVIVSLSGPLGRGNVSSLFPQGHMLMGKESIRLPQIFLNTYLCWF